MEVFFLDVGQGTCQVILLGNRRAIVVDCGLSTDRLVLQFLKRMGVEHIVRLIVSHCHNDHIGGAVSILGEYKDRIEKICLVQDDKLLESTFWKRISTFLESGALSKEQLVRLEVTGQPQLVWAEESFGLRTFSPSAAENLLAQEAGQPNATSAVLFLDTHGGRIVFSADSEVAQWKEIHQKSGRRITCRILAVPHHAGSSHNTVEDLDWLYDEALAADIAVISVGTSNTHEHPRRDVVEAITARGTKVMCTQITRRCSPDLESLRPGILQPLNYVGRSSPTQDVTGSGRSRNVACAGSIRAVVADEGIIVDRLNDHQRAVDNRLVIPGRNCPLCRLRPASAP